MKKVLSLFFIFFFSMNCFFAIDVTSDPILLYKEAMRAPSPQEQSRLFNQALSSFLDHKPEYPSATWHYNVASCFLALHEPGPAIYHYLEAERIHPNIGEVKQKLAQARQDVGLPPEIANVRPFWVLSFFSQTSIEVFFLVSCLTAFCIAVLGLFLENRLLLIAGKGLSILACCSALLLIVRYLQPLEAVVVSPEKLTNIPFGVELSRTLLPGEQVLVLEIRDKMIQVETIDGTIGWLSEKNCWVLTVTSG